MLSLPKAISFQKSHVAIVAHVRSLWWWTWRDGHKNVRALAWGNTVLIGPKKMEGDIEHELVHVDQFHRFPLVFPLLYIIEDWNHGHKDNKYESEAYDKAGNPRLDVPL